MPCLAGVSLLALAGPTVARAEKRSTDVDAVVVTGSRIAQSGYQRPTPVADRTIANAAISVFAGPLNAALLGVNQQAPLFPGSLVSGLEYPTLIQLYDVMGRYYTGGLRFKF